MERLNKNRMVVSGKRLTFLLCALCFFTSTVVSAAAEQIGILLADIKGCTLTTYRDNFPCLKGAFLSPGDIIHSGEGAKKLPIQWLVEDAVSFEKVKPNGEKIVFTPPAKQNKTVLDGIFSFFRARSTFARLGASRGSFEPGPATLLSDRTFLLDWCNDEAKEIIVKDAKGNKQYSMDVTGKRMIELDPLKLKLERGFKYTWFVTGIEDFPPQTLIRLSEQDEREIIANLGTISEGSQPPEAALRRAVYLSYLTGKEPQRTNFNWLINKELSDNRQLMNGDDQILARFLMKRSGYDACR